MDRGEPHKDTALAERFSEVLDAVEDSMNDALRTPTRPSEEDPEHGIHGWRTRQELSRQRTEEDGEDRESDWLNR